MSKEFLTALAGTLFVIGFIPYIIAIVRGSTKPVRSSWFLWAILDTITLIGMAKEDALNGHITGAVIGAWNIALLSLKYGVRGWSKLDTFCVVGAALGISAMLYTGEGVAATAISLTATFTVSIPTFRSAWEDYTREDRLGWSIYWISCVVALFAIPGYMNEWTIATAAQPIVFFVIESIIMFLIFIRPVISNKKFRVA